MCLDGLFLFHPIRLLSTRYFARLLLVVHLRRTQRILEGLLLIYLRCDALGIHSYLFASWHVHHQRDFLQGLSQVPFYQLLLYLGKGRNLLVGSDLVIRNDYDERRRSP